MCVVVPVLSLGLYLAPGSPPGGANQVSGASPRKGPVLMADVQPVCTSTEAPVVKH